MSQGVRNDFYRQTTLRIAAAMLTLTVASLQWTLFRAGARDNFGSFLDFRAFYCSAAVAATHADPYRAEPLGRCERNTVSKKPLTESGFVVPAPLPGWVILLLEPLTRLPFIAAATVWWSLLVAAFVALQLQVARCFPSLNAIAAFFLLLPLGLWIPVPLGQFVPVCIVLLIGAALLLRAGNDRAAAIMAAVATMEPHIALPVCLALFVARPKARVSLVLSAAVLAALSIAALGVHENLEYVLGVLPAHIASESAFRDQFSATSLATALGVPRGAAIVAGQASYWLLAIIAALLTRAYAAAGREPELMIFVPMAFSVLGGPYVHIEHLLAAVPLAMYLVAKTPDTRWSRVLVAVAVAWPLRSVILLATGLREIVIPLPPPFAGAQNLLAETPWAASIVGLQGSLFDVLTKIPSWAGLIALAAIAIAIAIAGHRRSEMRPT